MKHFRSIPYLVSCLATTASLLIPLQRSPADDGYRVETHGPRIGSRIVFFFKDLAYGQNPNDRYRTVPANQARMMPRQNAYGNPSGPGFNLDQPPPVNSMPPARMPFAPSPPASREMAPADLPYTTDAPRARERDRYRELADESLPPVKPKPKTPSPQKPTLASKLPAEEKPLKTPPPKEPAPSESSMKETQTASSTPSNRRSWQFFNADNGKEKETKTNPHPQEETKPTSSIVTTTSAATLTGSKTTKE